MGKGSEATMTIKLRAAADLEELAVRLENAAQAIIAACDRLESITTRKVADEVIREAFAPIVARAAAKPDAAG